MATIIRRLCQSLLVLLLALTPLQIAAAQEEENPQVRITQVDNSQFPNVTVYVSVTNAAGDPVGVDPATIQIFENGELMQPTNVQGGGDAVGGEAIPVTTMLVIDISGSMDKGNKIGAARDAANAYVNGMRESDQAGLITFDSQVYHVQNITSDKAALTAAINGLKTGSDTAMYQGILEATKALESVSGRKTILLLSDGIDNRSSATEEDIVNTVGPSGLTVSAIGFGEPGAAGQAGIDEAGLQSLTGRTGGQYAYVTDAATLNTVYQQYGQAFQSEYAITYTSPFTLRDGANRNLAAGLAAAGAAVPDPQAQYNPGGVLPEVAQGISWPVFGMILGALLLLLIVPLLFGNLFQGMKGKGGAKGFSLGKKKPQIKLK
jgi:Ca-activated chloride channel homolog